MKTNEDYHMGTTKIVTKKKKKFSFINFNIRKKVRKEVYCSMSYKNVG